MSGEKKKASELQRQTILVSARSFKFQIVEIKIKTKTKPIGFVEHCEMERDANQKFALASTEVHQAMHIIQAHFLCVM